MVIEMVWHDLKYFYTNECELSSKADLLTFVLRRVKGVSYPHF
jgi:hypothetical protein